MTVPVRNFISSQSSQKAKPSAALPVPFQEVQRSKQGREFGILFWARRAAREEERAAASLDLNTTLLHFSLRVQRDQVRNSTVQTCWQAVLILRRRRTLTFARVHLSIQFSGQFPVGTIWGRAALCCSLTELRRASQEEFVLGRECELWQEAECFRLVIGLAWFCCGGRSKGDKGAHKKYYYSFYNRFQTLQRGWTEFQFHW